MHALESHPRPLPNDLPPPTTLDQPCGNRLLWLTRVADGDPFGLASEVLDRIELDGGHAPLLGMKPTNRHLVARHFGDLTSRRLLAQPIDLQHYVRLIGDPIEAIRLAFEERGENEIAAACYALVHDKLAADDDHGHFAGICSDLRFCCVRCLSESHPRSHQSCRSLVRQILAVEDSDGHEGPRLREAMAAWLDDG